MAYNMLHLRERYEPYEVLNATLNIIQQLLKPSLWLGQFLAILGGGVPISILIMYSSFNNTPRVLHFSAIHFNH